MRFQFWTRVSRGVAMLWISDTTIQMTDPYAGFCATSETFSSSIGIFSCSSWSVACVFFRRTFLKVVKIHQTLHATAYAIKKTFIFNTPLSTVEVDEDVSPSSALLANNGGPISFSEHPTNVVKTSFLTLFPAPSTTFGPEFKPAFTSTSYFPGSVFLGKSITRDPGFPVVPVQMNL
mmetsp:Transcript_3427/g.12182  ORF Transcript_3427/g.12182 Transcript_3427/m.12182 type:complete len:177 (+) Transcript_3427:98-628(+)